MPRKRVKFVFARLVIYHSGDTGKVDLIRSSLSWLGTYHKGGFEWGVFDVDEVTHEGKTFLAGYLVKLRPTEEDEVVNRATHRITSAEVHDRVEAKSEFVLEADSGVMAFRPISNKIQQSQFLSRFAEVIEEANNQLFINVDLNTIQDDVDFLRSFRNFERISKLTFYLHPSNPSSRDLWKNVDDRLQELRAEKYSEKLESENEQGLHVADDDVTLGKIHMALDGYGEARVEGQMNRENKRISTKKLPVSVELREDIIAPGDAIPELFDHFRSIWGRITR